MTLIRALAGRARGSRRALTRQLCLLSPGRAGAAGGADCGADSSARAGPAARRIHSGPVAAAADPATEPGPEPELAADDGVPLSVAELTAPPARPSNALTGSAWVLGYEARPYALPFALVASYRQQRRDPAVRFRDVAVVKLASGAGGPGKVSFLRDGGRPVGPPDGGDGGAGGHVYVQAVEGLNSLHTVRHTYRAQAGRPGGAAQLSGRNGHNVVLQVPVGTVVHWAPPREALREAFDAAVAVEPGAAVPAPPRTLEFPANYVVNHADFGGMAASVAGTARPEAIQLARASVPDGHGWVFKEKEEDYFFQQPAFRPIFQQVRHQDMLARRREQLRDVFPVPGLDLSVPGDPIQILAGGAGGQGNVHFQSGTLRSPRFARQGRAGLEATFLLELRLLADLGLVGLPNAGKSSLLRAISRARPRVGHWEFTTLQPTIGTISLGISEPAFTVADIPGIAAGASENRGMGLGFLRHVERSGGLAFVVALDRPDPAADLAVLLHELGPARLQGKRHLVIGTKADLPGTEPAFAALAAAAAAALPGVAAIPCSALENGNVEAVIRMMGAAAGAI